MTPTASPPPPTAPLVVLLHGLFMNSLCMRYLGRLLSQSGYQVIYFVYPTLRRSPPENAEALAVFLRDLHRPDVHLVAHSLGGIVIRHLMANHSDLPTGRVVTLGTPHQGSQVAHRLQQSALRFMLGRTMEKGLCGTIPPWPAPRQIGSIAGTLQAGLGRIVGVDGPSDGTVRVAETEFPGMTDHLCLPCSHVSMLFSAAVAQQTTAFLSDGHFQPQGLIAQA